MALVHHGLCSHTVDLALNVENGLREAITDNVPREKKAEVLRERLWKKME